MGLLHDGDDEVVLVEQSVGRRRNPLPLLLGCTALVALLITQLPRALEQAKPSGDNPPTTPTTAPAASSSEPSEDPARIDFPKVSFLTMPPGGGRAELVPFTAPGEPIQLPLVTEIGADRSGRWIAALADHGDPEAPRVLFIGRGPRRLQAVSSAAQGFAWHDTEPGRIAFIENNGAEPGTLRTIDLNTGTRKETVVATGVGGWMQHYGNWGFAVQKSRSESRFTVVNPAGSSVLANQQGSVAGFVPGRGLLATFVDPGGEIEHRIIDIRTGADDSAPELVGQQIIWNLARGGTRGTFAIHASSFDFQNHNVIIFNRLFERVGQLPSTPLPQAMAWSPDGSELVFTVDDFENRTRVVAYDAATGTTLEGSYPESGQARLNRSILFE